MISVDAALLLVQCA